MPLAKLEAFESGIVDIAAFAKALSHPARIEILKLMAKSGELPCMEIVRKLPLSQPASSRHINELQKVGLLSSRINASNVFFKLNKEALQHYCTELSKTLHP